MPATLSAKPNVREAVWAAVVLVWALRPVPVVVVVMLKLRTTAWEFSRPRV